MTDDQRFASRRTDVLVYESDVLSEDVTLLGPFTASLNVSTSGTDSDFIVKLIDVYSGDFPNPEPNPRGLEMGGASTSRRRRRRRHGPCCVQFYQIFTSIRACMATFRCRCHSSGVCSRTC